MGTCDLSLLLKSSNRFLQTQGLHPEKQKPPEGGFCELAEWTGLEPATPGVTGRYSNQLNYHSMPAT
jgi:hypothetical protein